MKIEGFKVVSMTWTEEAKRAACLKAAQAVADDETEDVIMGCFTIRNTITGEELHASYIAENGTLTLAEHESYESAVEFTKEFSDAHGAVESYSRERVCGKMVLLNNPELN